MQQKKINFYYANLGGQWNCVICSYTYETYGTKSTKKRQAEWNWIKQQVKSISYVLYAPMVIAELQYTF